MASFSERLRDLADRLDATGLCGELSAELDDLAAGLMHRDARREADTLEIGRLAIASYRAAGSFAAAGADPGSRDAYDARSAEVALTESTWAFVRLYYPDE